MLQTLCKPSVIHHEIFFNYYSVFIMNGYFIVLSSMITQLMEIIGRQAGSRVVHRQPKRWPVNVRFLCNVTDLNSTKPRVA